MYAITDLSVTNKLVSSAFSLLVSLIWATEEAVNLHSVEKMF